MLKALGSVRFQVIVFMLLVVLAGNLSLNYFLTQNAQEMLIQEKQEKLEKLGHYLVRQYNYYFVDEQGEYKRLAREHFEHYTGATPKTQEDIFNELAELKMNSTLRGIVDTSTNLFSDEIGAGFFIQGKNRVYGFFENPTLYSYEKLIARVPIDDKGSFVWVEESYRNIHLKVATLQRRTDTITTGIVLILLLFSLLFGFSFTNRIKRILSGLRALKKDLHTPMPSLGGELGGITRGIDQLAQSLVQSRTRSDIILNNATTGMISLDKEQNVLFFNQAALHLLSIQDSSITIDQIQHTLGPVLESVIKRSFTANTTFTFDNFPVTLPQKQCFFNIVVSTHLDHHQEPLLLITLDDVTENVKLIREAEKNESLRMLGMFTTGIAHEIRNPLTSVKGFVQLLGKKVQTVDGAPRMVQLVIREIDRLEMLLKDLITYARPSKTIDEWVKLSDLIGLIENLSKERLQQKKCSITIRDLDQIEIYTDQRKVHQVLFNLVLNAIQAVKVGEGALSIYGITEDHHFWICVQDNGYGIAKEDFHKIYTPFYTTKDKGTGLGLAISRRMMEDMQGKIEFNSTPGDSTVFRIGFSKWREISSKSAPA